MKPYIVKPSATNEADSQTESEQPEAPDFELEDPLPENVEGFDPYNTGVFKIDKGPWKTNKP